MSLILRSLAILCAFTATILVGRAEDTAALKTEYYEAATNGAKEINYKRWNTSRGDKVIVTHAERDLTRSGKFEQVDTLIFHDGNKVLQFTTLLGKKTCFFYPEPGVKVTQSDSDGDGRYDRIILSDKSEQIVDCFSIAADGKVTPLPDVELKKLRDTMKNFGDAMKDFDKH